METSQPHCAGTNACTHIFCCMHCLIVDLSADATLTHSESFRESVKSPCGECVAFPVLEARPSFMQHVSKSCQQTLV